MLAATLLTWTWTGGVKSRVSDAKEAGEFSDMLSSSNSSSDGSPSKARAGTFESGSDDVAAAERNQCGVGKRRITRAEVTDFSVPSRSVRQRVTQAFLLSSCIASCTVLGALTAGSAAGAWARPMGWHDAG